MNIQTPTHTPTNIMPVNKPKDGHARIGIAVIGFPHTITAFAHDIISGAIDAGLRQCGVKVVERAGYYRPLFSVSMVTVNAGHRADAINSVKLTLAGVRLLERAAIAIYTDEQVWLSVHGFDLGGISWEAMFLKQEEIDACKKEVAGMIERSEVMRALAIDMLKPKAEEPDGTDSK